MRLTENTKVFNFNNLEEPFEDIFFHNCTFHNCDFTGTKNCKFFACAFKGCNFRNIEGVEVFLYGEDLERVKEIENEYKEKGLAVEMFTELDELRKRRK